MVNAVVPEEISEETQQVLGMIVAAQEAMNKAEHWLDTARKDRDHYIALLRVHGWTLRQISAFTGLSISGLMKISEKEGIVATRGALVTPK